MTLQTNSWCSGKYNRSTCFENKRNSINILSVKSCYMEDSKHELRLKCITEFIVQNIPCKHCISFVCILNRCSRLFKHPRMCSIFQSQSYSMPTSFILLTSRFSSFLTSSRIVCNCSDRSLAVFVFESSHFLWNYKIDSIQFESQWKNQKVQCEIQSHFNVLSCLAFCTSVR